MPRPNRKPNKPDIERPYREIGERIREARIRHKLDQKDIRAGGSTITISRIENGFRAPGVELLQYLHDELGEDLNYIICGK